MQDVLPAHEADSDELIGLPEALDGMPEQQRRALLLREWQGLSYKEIAEELDLSQAAVETLLFRARRSLAAGLSDEPPKKAAAIAKRLGGAGDLGSALSILKSLLLTGGVEGRDGGRDGRGDLGGRRDAGRRGTRSRTSWPRATTRHPCTT